jgi:hypothetical protein
MTMAKNKLKQLSLYNKGFSSCVALRICFLTHLVPVNLADMKKKKERERNAHIHRKCARRAGPLSLILYSPVTRANLAPHFLVCGHF